MDINTLASSAEFLSPKSSPISSVVIFFSFFFATLLVEIVKKIFYYFKAKKRYYVIPRPSIQGIANIAMTIALSVAVLLLLTFVTSNAFSVLFRAFPGSRITIEGILIKIGGLLYGPFIGMLIGGLTDIFSILMTAGVFHYGYFIAGMAYGLLAGLVRSVLSFAKESRTWYAIISSIIATICSLAAIVFIYSISTSGFEQSIITFIPFIPSSPDKISREFLSYIFIGFCVFVVLLIWLFFFFSNRYQKWKMLYGNKKHFKITRPKKIDKHYFNNFCLILICCIITEVWINVLLMPSIDADVSTLGYDDWFIIRVAMFIPMIIFNFVIIFPVYVIIAPIVQWDYKKELVEDLKVPFFVK
ncbi:glutamyl-tRNA amidotransferase subunit C-related protein [Malacoplasma penetrans HF-2]|uniref:Glutamyl-tRNA amidotransferase subunit C-related protein n=1 Tax=Malacoplasma penetrans (strain HF-2) TaxID=272633 RepID=Q8EWJ5_MALP2|nr:ECF transporter S component [Malacoplasma penetrans]BAC43999.1 glutamyl-tRNA amidotransferase subunit C-related protein [Malacoplasma penetrans HF-2]